MDEGVFCATEADGVNARLFPFLCSWGSSSCLLWAADNCTESMHSTHSAV
jgi:hypothetical protein